MELIFVALGVLLYAYPFWRIAKKMGYPGPVGLVGLVPGINLLLAYVMAFTTWPIERHLRKRENYPGRAMPR